MYLTSIDTVPHHDATAPVSGQTSVQEQIYKPSDFCITRAQSRCGAQRQILEPGALVAPLTTRTDVSSELSD
jgi:hypothetical protein